MKKIITFLFLGSFIFSGIQFNQSTVFSNLNEEDGDGVNVNHVMGVDFDMNDNMTIGYDQMLGMLFTASGPSGLNFRIGYHADGVSTYGVGITWWSGGQGIESSLSTVVDYSTAGNNEEETTVRMNLNWGF